VVAQELALARAYKHKFHSAHVTRTGPLPAGFDIQAGGISIEAGFPAAVHGLSQQQAANLPLAELPAAASARQVEAQHEGSSLPQLQPGHHHQQQLLPGGYISRGAGEARHPLGTTAGTPAPGLLPDNLRKDMHNHNKGRSASNRNIGSCSKNLSALDLCCLVCRGYCDCHRCSAQSMPNCMLAWCMTYGSC
jgi:hypothetical protein